MAPSRRTITIGVTGHRVLSDFAALMQGVDAALSAVRDSCPVGDWQVVSALAEGADRIVARRAMELLGAKLIAILPLSQAEYAADFRTTESQEEFRDLLDRAEQVVQLPGAASREDAYAAAAAYMLDQCDVLVAVWDGQDEQGPSGTGAVVARARERDKPLAWIHAGNRRPGTDEPTSLGGEQGALSMEHFDGLAGSTQGDDVDQESLSKIRDAHERWDRVALHAAEKRLHFAKVAIATAPLAVLVVTIQAIAFPHGGTLAFALIGLELIALLIALATGYLKIGRSHRTWIQARIRAEIFRREAFLFEARVGPYLSPEPKHRRQRASERVLKIDNELKDPVDLLPLQDGERSWRDELDAARHVGAGGALEDIRTSMGAYLQKRIREQRTWFAERSRSHARCARNYENLTRAILAIAFMAAAIHLGLLFSHESQAFLHGLLTTCAIVAPTIAAALVGFQSVKGSHRLSRSYRIHHQALEGLETRLGRLVGEEGSGGRDTAIAHGFQQTVLDTEEVLSREMLVWWMIMHTEAPRAL